MRAIRDNKKSGFSLMEMLVSIVIGMIVVAAASTMLVNILKSQKDTAASARLNQDLGTAMAVISNEIRRAGFSVCDVDTFDCPDNNADGIEDTFIIYNAPTFNADLDIGEGGGCIEYRYNENRNDVDGPEEHRGFRLKDISIQMADPGLEVTCGDDINWIDLTDPNVIEVTALSFSTTGSKCRNMKTGGQSWAVGKLDADGNIVDNDPSNPDTVAACEVSAGTNVVLYDESVTPFPDIASFDITWKDPLSTETSTILFGNRQITIKLQATLKNDPAALKTLETSVKVANPRVEPFMPP